MSQGPKTIQSGETAALQKQGSIAAPVIAPDSLARQSSIIPLVVDLDGTLIATDSLFEAALALLKKQPACFLLFFVWALRGKAFLKAEIAQRLQLSVENLPYRLEVLAFLNLEREAGRKLVLATASHQSTADAVAKHLGLFDQVIASNESINLKGPRKRDELIKLFGVRGFDYMGDSHDDIPVWEASRFALVVGRAPSAIRASAKLEKVFDYPRPTSRTWIKAIRVQQWVKNVLLFIPTFAAHNLEPRVLTNVLMAFFAFSFIASAAYVVNDLFDMPVDRKHPKKRYRPFASGQLSIRQGFVLEALLMTAGFGLAATVGWALVTCLIVYLGLTFAYSSFLKNKPILDVVVLALFYTLRVFTGGIVSGEYISPWLFQFSIFWFLSLAFVKRYSELYRLQEKHVQSTPGRGYRLDDLHIISQAGVGSGLLAALVLALYVNGQEIQRLYPSPQMLWGISPIFLYWITRVWLIAHRGNMNEDPIIYAFHDKVSYIVGLLIASSLILGMIAHVG